MKRCINKMGGVLILITCMLLLNGCWGKREVEELAPLIGLGIDLGQKPGTFLITSQYVLPKKGGTTGAEIEGWTYSAEVSSGREVVEIISKSLNRIPFMGSLRVIVIGEDAAKAGFDDILDFAQRFSEFRRSLYLVLAKGKAQNILNTKLAKGELAAMYIKSNLETGEATSASPSVRLGHYLTVLGRKSTAPIIPVVEKINPGEGVSGNELVLTDGEQQIQLRLQGAGVLRGDKLVDYLTDEESKGYMWLENNVVHRSINTVGSEENKVNFGGQVLKSSTRYKVKAADGTIGLQYQIKVSIAVDEVLGSRKQFSNTEWVNLMKVAENSFAKVIEKECEISIRKEKKLGLDFLGIGRHIEEQNPKYWKTVKDQWEEKIKDFPIYTNIEVVIHHSGMSNSSVINPLGEGQE